MPAVISEVVTPKQRRGGKCTTAGSAASGQISNLFGAEDDLPCADFGLLALLKRSPEYDTIRRRAVNRRPVDAWMMNGEHYFVFELYPVENGAATTTATSFALFKMRWEDNGPVAALIITPGVDGATVEVRDVRQPDNIHLLPLSGNGIIASIAAKPRHDDEGGEVILNLTDSCYQLPKKIATKAIKGGCSGL